MPLGLLGVDTGGVLLEHLLTFAERRFGFGPTGGSEPVPRLHLLQPVDQLGVVDLVLLELGIGEVLLGVFLLHFGQEALAAVDDLLVLIGPGSLEGVQDALVTRQHGRLEQHAGSVHRHDLALQLA